MLMGKLSLFITTFFRFSSSANEQEDLRVGSTLEGNKGVR